MKVERRRSASGRRRLDGHLERPGLGPIVRRISRAGPGGRRPHPGRRDGGGPLGEVPSAPLDEPFRERGVSPHHREHCPGLGRRSPSAGEGFLSHAGRRSSWPTSVPQILRWLREVPEQVRRAAGTTPVRLALKLMNARFDDAFQLEMLGAGVLRRRTRGVQSALGSRAPASPLADTI